MTTIEPSSAPKLAKRERGAFSRFALRLSKAAPRILRPGWCILNLAIAAATAFAPITPGLVDPDSKPGLIWMAIKFLYWLSQIIVVTVLAFRRKLRWCIITRIVIFVIAIIFPDLRSHHAQNAIIYVGYELFRSGKIMRLKREILAEHKPYTVLHAVMYDEVCTSSIILDPHHNFLLPDGDDWVEEPGELYIEYIYHINSDVISEYTCIP